MDPARGLDLFEVDHRRERFGPNRLKEREDRLPILQFLLQFHQPLVYVLLASALITAIMKGYVEAAVIFGVVLVNAVIGSIQESKALKAIHALSTSLTSRATVLRAGNKLHLPADALVLGDIVLLQSGDKVPADLRLIQVRDLQIDESALTGNRFQSKKTHRCLRATRRWAIETTWLFPPRSSLTARDPAWWFRPATRRNSAGYQS